MIPTLMQKDIEMMNLIKIIPHMRRERTQLTMKASPHHTTTIIITTTTLTGKSIGTILMGSIIKSIMDTRIIGSRKTMAIHRDIEIINIIEIIGTRIPIKRTTIIMMFLINMSGLSPNNKMIIQRVRSLMLTILSRNQLEKSLRSRMSNQK
jgi:hypothetical protein